MCVFILIGGNGKVWKKVIGKDFFVGELCYLGFIFIFELIVEGEVILSWIEGKSDGVLIINFIGVFKIEIVKGGGVLFYFW